MSATEGCATISDATGNLLFYTDGVVVYNKTHAVMVNGSGLFGNWSTTQSAVIVKQPGTPNIYYIFTADALAGALGVCYSKVDMTLSGGLGAVTVKNSTLFAPATEKIAAVQHANGNDVWIVTHEWNTNNFVSYLLTSSGLNPTPVITPVGSVHKGVGWGGYLKASPNGKKLGLVITDSPVTLNGPTIELYDFDDASGVVSNSLALSAIPYPYGCEFSPDNTKFYAGPHTTGSGNILQWDLCAGSKTAILASQYTVATSLNVGSLQLGPDGKIYFSGFGNAFLDIIQNPNQAGAACNYVTPGISISPKTCRYGLPNYLRSTPLSITFTQNPVNCNNILFAAHISTNISVTSWDFGDPASGAANTSTAGTPVHIYPAGGIYTVALVAGNCAGQYTTYITVNTTNSVTVSSAPSSTFCFDPDNTCTLTAAGANSYTWSGYAPGSSLIVTPTVSAVYTVSATSVNNCVATLTTAINIYPLPQLAVNGPTAVCEGSKAILTTSGAASYTWSGSAPGPSLVVTPTVPTVFTVSALSANNCAATLTTAVSVFSLPQVIINGPTVACSGTSIILTASGANSYTWNGSAPGSSFAVTPITSAVYTVAATDTNSCAITVTTPVNVNPLPQVAINGPTLVCKGTSATLTASGAASYTWSTNAATATISVSPTIATSYTVAGTNTLGCVNSKTLMVNYSACTGLKEVSLADQLSIYPNPVSGNELFISAPVKGQLSIHDISGGLKLEVQIPEGTSVLNLSGLSKGVYFARYKTSEGSKEVRVVKTGD